ncbi:DUF2971 domain-containing protein [Spirosoma agri]|uniref:DUF2971 domain-containing protein n=1 Tax=Spirosoma agri TaxID=1987381 RepID=A0A6M0IIY1_9BACT|nr:DUF2971 domain-containing protein [Spirosoma agri]NEU67792.1 DUF2971 domain-containing protein [Spirosoma agri]
MNKKEIEEAERMLFNVPIGENPKIWRYMDFTKYVSMLNSSKLHLTRCDQFEDQYEGYTPKQEVLKRLEEFKKEHTDKHKYTPEQSSELLKWVWEKFQRQYIFINCWHMNEYESAAMWKLYAKSNEAISIQTTYDKLRNALPMSCHVGKVKYIDYQVYTKEKDEKTYNVMFKRKSFEHEKELRVCYADVYDFEQAIKNPDSFEQDNPRTYEQVPINLSEIIEAVLIAPGAPRWFSDLVEDVTEKFDCHFPIIHSDLNKGPIY